MGIPPEEFEHIFEKYGQVESHQGGRGNSTGLGLTYCKYAAQAHGGGVAVASEEGLGSTFSFLIPIEQPLLI
jgi:signal transduction histidine kinase